MRAHKSQYWTEYEHINRWKQSVSFQVGYSKDDDIIEIDCIELIMGFKDGKIEVVDVTDILDDGIFSDIDSYLSTINENEIDCMDVSKYWRENNGK